MLGSVFCILLPPCFSWRAWNATRCRLYCHQRAPSPCRFSFHLVLAAALRPSFFGRNFRRCRCLLPLRLRVTRFERFCCFFLVRSAYERAEPSQRPLVAAFPAFVGFAFDLPRW